MSFIIIAVTAVTLVTLGGTAIYSTVGTVRNTQFKEQAHTHIPLDSLSNPYEAAVAEVTVNNGGSLTSCSASHVGPSGQVLTAVHCFQQPAICDYDPVVREYPLSTGSVLVDVAGVNGTGEKWSFPAVVLGWSGILDIMVLQLSSLVKGDGSIITLATQPYLRWGSNRLLERGEPARSLSFDLAFLKKLGHSGAVLHPYADRGSSFAVTSEQVFIDLNAQDGASGSAALNDALQMVMAPLTYGWVSLSGDVYAVSGTSADVSRPLVQAMLSGARLPNGPAHRKYLVPSLGVVPLYVLSGINLQYYINTVYGTVLENKGLVFDWLASQEYYDFLVSIHSCGFPPYNMTAPSLLGARVNQVFGGNPPDPFQDFPAYDGNTVVVLMALERNHQWVYLGEDAGLETVSGVLATGGYWVGDTVRVRIKSVNPYEPNNPNATWEAAYNVTLQPIDPFWDTIQSGPFINYASLIRVNQTQGAPMRLHLDPSVARSQQMMARRRRSKAHTRNAIGGSNPNFEPVPPGVDVGTLPTLGDLYRAHRGH